MVCAEFKVFESFFLIRHIENATTKTLTDPIKDIFYL